MSRRKNNRDINVGSHLLEVHLIGSLEVTDDPSTPLQRNHHHIDVPVDTEAVTSHKTNVQLEISETERALILIPCVCVCVNQFSFDPAVFLVVCVLC